MIKKKNCRNGFSLIELMVVFSLIAIVSSIGFASFANYSRKQILSQAASDVKSMIDMAKFNALSSVKPNSTCLNNALFGYRLAICAVSPQSCLAGGQDYQLIGMCESGDILRIGKKLPQNISITNPAVDSSCSQTVTYPNCTEIKFNSLSNVIEGAPCVVTVTGYGNTSKLCVDGAANVSIK